MIIDIVQFLHNLFQQSAEIALFLSIALGFWIGRFKFGSFQLGGVAGSLLVAVILSQVGVHIDDGIKNVLFALFIYAVGFQSGPGFFRSLGRETLREVFLAVFLAVSALATVVVVARMFHLDKGLAAGIAAGGLTQSAIIGTAGSALAKLGLPAAQLQHLQGNVAIGYAVTYLFGAIGPIFVCTVLLPMMRGASLREDAIKAELSAVHTSQSIALGGDSAFPKLVGRVFRVAVGGLSVSDVETELLAVEQIKRENQSISVSADVGLLQDDLVLLYGNRCEVASAGKRLGTEVTAVEGMDVSLMQQDLCLSSKALIGKPILQWMKQFSPGTRRGVYLIGVRRGGHAIEVSDDVRSKAGDVITVFGTAQDIQRLANQIGPAVLPSEKTDFVFHGFGLVIGLLIGLLVWRIGSVPLTLGSGGGALLSGLLFGWYQSRHSNVGNLPASASFLLIDIGLASFVAVTGLQTGQQAIVTIMHMGLTLFLMGVAITIIPLILTMLFGQYVLRYKNVAIFAGALSGARSANPAFGEVLNEAGNSVPTVPFAITYAIANVLLTLLGPLIVAFT